MNHEAKLCIFKLPSPDMLGLDLYDVISQICINSCGHNSKHDKDQEPGCEDKICGV
jgi:hypothetical protein